VLTTNGCIANDQVVNIVVAKDSVVNVCVHIADVCVADVCVLTDIPSSHSQLTPKVNIGAILQIQSQPLAQLRGKERRF
jgi:hypothetical protein